MDGIDLSELRELIEFLKANEIAEFDVEKGDLKLRLTFAGKVAAAAAAAPAGFDMGQLARLIASSPEAGAAAAPPQASAAGASEPAASGPAAESHHIVKSPIVGTFYEAPSPGAPPFVKVGDMVEVGQVLCIVEAMKLMNEVESDMAGEVMERIPATGQPVEYGQSLFAIKPR